MFRSKPLSQQDNIQSSSNYQLPATSYESGVTLVISIVMLAVVTFVSFSISTIVIREIGAARLLLRSEPAISGANSGGEVGLYRLLREVGGTQTSGQLSQSGASYQVKSDLYEDDPFLFSITDQQILKIALYDSENSSKTTNNYQSVTITNTQNNPFKVTVYSWSNTKNPVCPTQNITKGNSSSCNLTSLDDRYIVQIDPSGQNVNGQASALRDDGTRGIPAASPGLDITGSSGNVQRRIEIELKTQ